MTDVWDIDRAHQEAAKRGVPLYIAGPMTGIAELNYPAFHAAKDALRTAGFGVRSPTDHEVDGDLEWEDWMRRDIPLLLECEGVAVLPGWENSRGASLEVHIAKALDMPVLSLDEWLS